MASTSPVALKPVPNRAVTLTTAMRSPGNSVDPLPRAMWLPGSREAARTVPATTTNPVATMALATTMEVAARVALPLGLHRTATTATHLRADMLLLVLPPPLPILGSSRLLLAASLPMDTVHTVDILLLLLAWELPVLFLLAWALPHPLLAWLPCTMELLAALHPRRLLVTPRHLPLRATSLPHLLPLREQLPMLYVLASLSFMEFYKKRQTNQYDWFEMPASPR